MPQGHEDLNQWHEAFTLTMFFHHFKSDMSDHLWNHIQSIPSGLNYDDNVFFLAKIGKNKTKNKLKIHTWIVGWTIGIE